jgi:DNA-binding HxlR family transcriptional regulator
MTDEPLPRGVADVPQIGGAAPSREASDFEMIRGTQAVLDLLAGKWSVRVLYLLASGTRRYSEVFYEIGEVSKKALTRTLRTLQQDGLIARRAYAEMPMRVEYSLTQLGWSITPLLMTMYEWAAEHEAHLQAPRGAAHGADADDEVRAA